MPDERSLLDAMRTSLLDGHVTPMLDAMHRRVRLGQRTLLGSLSSGIANGILRAADALPGGTAANIGTRARRARHRRPGRDPAGAGGEPFVQRRTCCLAFTLPEPKLCTGCCIKPT